MKISDRHEVRPGESVYDDTEEDCFRFMLWSGTGIDLPSIDSFLEDDAVGVWDSEAGRLNRRELLDLREQALIACKSGNFVEMDACARALHAECALIGYQFVAREMVERDDARQAGTRKERRPQINEWISARLEKNPEEKVPTMWEEAPQWITDSIGKDAFKKRVTNSRKKRRK